jgi:hypothetical protein
MKKLLKLVLMVMFTLFANLGMAQQAEMADGLRSEGKIYVVVLIILIVLFGLITYLFLLDRKLAKMEKLLDEKQQTKS